MKSYRYDGSKKFSIKGFDCGDTGEFKEALDAAVLPALSVKAEEYDIRVDCGDFADVLVVKVKKRRIGEAASYKCIVDCAAAAEGNLALRGYAAANYKDFCLFVNHIRSG